MKGSVPLYFGLIIAVMITVIFMMDKNTSTSKKVEIATNTVNLFIGENSVESAKRSIDSFVYFSGIAVLKEIFSAGKEWTADGPLLEDLKSDYDAQLLKKLNSLSIEKIGTSTLEWKSGRVESFFQDDGIHLVGEKGFSLQTAGNPSIKIESSGSFDRKIPIRAKGIFEAGKALLGVNDWTIKKSVVETEADECKELVSENLLDGEFYKTKVNSVIDKTVVCGYGSSAGGHINDVYKKDEASERISQSLNELAAVLNAGSGFSYHFSSSVSSSKVGTRERVSVEVLVSISDPQSLVPSETNFVPLALKYNTKIEFEMDAPAEASD